MGWLVGVSEENREEGEIIAAGYGVVTATEDLPSGGPLRPLSPSVSSARSLPARCWGSRQRAVLFPRISNAADGKAIFRFCVRRYQSKGNADWLLVITHS